jgi:hypothetical protein
MDKRQKHLYEMLESVRIFLEVHIGNFPPESIAQACATTIEVACAELREHHGTQLSGFASLRGDYKQVKKARERLRKRLEAISRTARGISRYLPQFDAPFQLPKSESHDALMKAATSFLEHCAAAKDAFIRYGMPINFMDEFRADIEALQSNRKAVSEAHEARKRGTAGIQTAIDKALKAIAEMDIVVHNVFLEDRVMIKNWKAASHYKRPASRKARAASAKPL